MLKMERKYRPCALRCREELLASAAFPCALSLHHSLKSRTMGLPGALALSSRSYLRLFMA